MISSTISVRVRYGETDQMGIVYHGNYSLYFEQGRIELFREIGLPYKEMEERGIMLPVNELNVRYLKPAYYDDLLKVETIINAIPLGARFRFDYKIWNQKEELLTIGFAVLAFVDMKTKRPIRCPEYISEHLQKFQKTFFFSLCVDFLGKK